MCNLLSDFLVFSVNGFFGGGTGKRERREC